MGYRIGLDIGIASVGFSVMETDEHGEPVSIKDLGVRIFERAEQPKTGDSLAEPRRTARGARRRTRRAVHRKERVQTLLKEKFGEEIVEGINGNFEDVYFLRYKGLDKELTAEQLGKVLLYFINHRGFLSNRKSELKEGDVGKLLSATKNNSEYLKEKNYRTIGEMLYLDGKYYTEENGQKVYHTRNKADSYDNTFLRDDLKSEILQILNKQKELGLVTQEFIDKYIYIFYTNRNYDEGPAEPSKYRGGYAIGKCPFYPEEERAPKATYTFEYCTALEKLNNLQIHGFGEIRSLSEEEREKVIDKIKSKSEIKFAELRKWLNIKEEETFNLLSYSSKKANEEVEKVRFVSMANSYKIRKCLSEENILNIELLDKIGLILSKLKSDNKRKEKFDELKELSEKEIENLLEINCAKFGNTSLKFLNAIKPFLEKGEKYSDACKLAGFNHTQAGGNVKTKLLNTKEIRDQINDIAVPVVKRAVSQTVKVINAIINKYGSPDGVNIELARELSKTHKEREKIKKDNEERAQENERIKSRLQNEFGLTLPTGQDILKFLLYEEQGGKCAYSQQEIKAERLFESNYTQIDHIIPYSKSFDDSMSNKVLVLTKENQQKKNRLPFEYFGEDKKRWESFENFVKTQYKGNRVKTDKLLKKKFTEQDEKDWREKNLNDTKYISKFVYNLIKDNLELREIDGVKKNVRAVNGKITAYMRKLMGLNKVREDGDKHHALDATVIACVTDGDIQKITNFNKGKEYLLRIDNGFIDENGVVIPEEEYDKQFGKVLPPPYEGFREELTYRLAENPKYYEEFFVKQGYSDEKLDSLRPVFVSRVVNKKVIGKIHDDTIRSAKIFDETGEVITKKPLTALHLTKDGTEIEGYYKKEDDKLLYNHLLKLLQDNGGDAKVAFKDKVYKPKSDGTQGAEVKKVKIKEKATDGMFLSKINGFAANGGMIRIDVFNKDGKYYVVPVYVKDAYAKKLPNKAIINGKPYKDWQEIDDTFEFLFSLYKNDLIYVRHKNGIKLVKTDGSKKEITIKEGFLYYNNLDISGGKATVITHDNSYETRIGLKTLEKIEKYTVDIFGEKTKVIKETRQDFSNFKRNN